jgi:hypothetical protein
MANIFEDGITHSNFEAILTDPGLLAALQVSEWSAGDFKTVNKNLIEVGWEQIREILAKIYKVQAPVATIALDDIDLEASLHNAARVDVVLDLQRINRVLNAALHNEYPVPHLVAWKMPNGFIKLLDGLHRYTTFRAVKRKSLKAYLVECDETIADLIARSLNAHCGIGQLTEYSVSQAVEYVINKGVGNGDLAQIAAYFCVNNSYLQERVHTQRFVIALIQDGLVTTAILALSTKLLRLVRRHPVFKTGDNPLVYSPEERAGKARVLNQALAYKLSCDKVKYILDGLLAAHVQGSEDIDEIIMGSLETLGVTIGGGFGAKINPDPQLNIVQPMGIGVRFRNAVNQLRGIAVELPDDLVGIYPTAQMTAEMQFSVSVLINELNRLK